MGVVGCILGFLVVIYLCYKDWSVYIASIVGAAVVIAFNVLPFMDTLLDSYVNGMFVPIKSFFFLLLFGSIQSKIYSESGAAFSIADTIMSKLLRPGASNTKKNVIAVAVIVAIGIILCMGGINASVFIVLMYPVALTIFEYCDIPKRFILGVLAAASYTFTLTMPGSPQVTNVAAMTALGTAADVALVPGLVGAAVEVVVIIVLMNIYINKARAKGEHFELHPLDPHYDKNTPRPNFWIALIPLVALFVTFNILKININICVTGSTVLSILLFWKQLKAKNLRELISTGAADSIHMSLTVAAICGFAGVVSQHGSIYDHAQCHHRHQHVPDADLRRGRRRHVHAYRRFLHRPADLSAAHRTEAARLGLNVKATTARLLCRDDARFHAVLRRHPDAAADVPHEAQGDLSAHVYHNGHRHDLRHDCRHRDVRAVPRPLLMCMCASVCPQNRKTAPKADGLWGGRSLCRKNALRTEIRPEGVRLSVYRRTVRRHRPHLRQREPDGLTV